MEKDPHRQPEALSDEDSLLMLEVASGSDHAMRMLVEKWKNPLVNFFYRNVRNLATSEDLAQQTFINLYKARENYSAKAKFSTYLFSIARNVFINDYRRNARRPQGVELLPETDPGVDGRGDMELGELEEIFELVLQSLPETQRTAILLLKQQELSYDEIAAVMEANVGAVKTWIHRARQTLKEALGAKL